MNVYSLAVTAVREARCHGGNSETNVVPGVGPIFSIGTARRPTAIFAGQILQPLSQQYRIGLEIKQAGLAREVEGEKLRRSEQTTVNQVKQNYYGILQTRAPSTVSWKPSGTTASWIA